MTWGRRKGLAGDGNGGQGRDGEARGLVQEAESMQVDRPMIEVSNLVVRYGNKAAVDSVSFTVERGEHLTLLGPSGCGKTTTLRSIAGLEQPAAGVIRLDGRTVFSSEEGINTPTEKRGVSMVFQSYGIWPHMTVFDNVAYGLRVRGLPRATIEENVDRALGLVQMREFSGQSATKLSGGQQQRVSLARALAFSPSIVLFDEPLSNLDAKLRAQMRVELRDLQRRLKITSVYVTHDQEEALAISTRVIVMKAGRVEQIGTPEEIYDRPRTAFIADFVGSANLVRGRVCSEKPSNGRILFECAGGVTLEIEANKVQTGGEQTVAVRTAYIQLGDGISAGGVNCFPGTVFRRVFHGDFIQYVIEWAAGQLVVRRPPTDILEEGAGVVISFTPKHCVLLEA